jgi:hypothetical protein
MQARLWPAGVSAAFWTRFVAASVLGFLVLASGLGAYASSAPEAARVVVLAGFGSPPSGEIPIFYNDQHVYAKPDVLRAGRVLAGLVKNGVILVPLRSMFEQMGATVSYDAATKSFRIEKSGASIRLALGKNESIINGESRPLDQGPIMYRGVALVPIRVISEAMGAYVEWVPSRRLAVVRYVPPTPVPSPVVTPRATPVPAPSATPASRAPYPGFVQAAFAWGKNYNEFSAGQYCRNGSYAAGGAYAFPGSPFAVKVDFRQDEYVTSDEIQDSFGNHYTIYGTIDGGFAFTPVFLARQSTLDARLEFKVAEPRIYIGGGYLRTSTNYGYPHLNGAGGGVEKLPDLWPGIGVFGSVFYYPTASGDYTVNQPTSTNFGKSYRQQYQILKYDVGLDLAFKSFPVYVYGGFSGDRYVAKQNAPLNQTHSGPYVGLGVRF